MFTMIGGDGQEYGPVTAEQLQEWILDHRANGRTLVRAEGEMEWKPLFLRPEFAGVLAEAAQRSGSAPAPPGTEGGATVPGAWAARAGAAPAGRFGVMDCVGRAWGLLQRHMLLVLSASLGVWLIPTALNFLGFLGALTGWLLSGPLYGGLCVLVLQLARGQPAGLGTVWSCFDARLLPCLLVTVFTEMVTQLGLILLLLPGIFFATVWAFSLPLAADRGWTLLPALRGSWQMVAPRFFRVLGTLVLGFLPVVVFSAYTLVVMSGWAVEVLGPDGFFSWAEFWDRLPELSQRGALLAFQQRMVWLLNLPFAWAVLITAYEDLFTAGRT